MTAVTLSARRSSELPMWLSDMTRVLDERLKSEGER